MRPKCFRARAAGVLRQDLGARDLATMIGAMSKVIAMSNGDNEMWRRHLGFVLDGLRV
jgi:Transcriptional regulator SbtR-like, C-terminal domain